jgi:uncharacterized protein YecE (DUF72 family)
MKKLIKLKPNNDKIKYAFEFRDTSWYNNDVYKLFEQRLSWTMVIAFNCECFGSMNYGFNFDIKTFIPTSNFLYIRMHGTTGKYEGSHKKYIPKLTEFIMRSGITNVYIYFNNTDSSTGSVPDALYDVNYMNKYLF